jgi:Family of unknown function (DUF6263)
MQRLKLPALILFTIISFNALSQQKVSLEKGKKYMVESKTTVTSSAEVMGQSMESNVESNSTTVYEVVNPDAAGTELKSTITKLKVNSNAMGQEIKYDSDGKNNEGPAAEMLAGRVNKPKSVTIDTKGTITKQDIDEDGDAAMMGINTESDNKLDLFIPVLFTRKLVTGDSFMDSSKVKKDKYESNEVGTYKVTAVENGVASISYSGRQVVAAVMEQMGMEMTNNSTNVINSEMQVEIKTGMVLAKASVTESTMSIETAGMSIPAKAKTITTVKISPVN